MSRGYQPEEHLDPREVHEEAANKPQRASRNDQPRDEVREEREQGTAAQTNPGTAHSPELRKVYEIRGRTYRLRTSEIAAMVELGKFRAVAREDLAEFAYGGKNDRMRLDLENLVRQGLVAIKSIPHHEMGSRQLLALTRNGYRFLVQTEGAAKGQSLYCGFAKPREAHHDADLYRLYQKAAAKLESDGGRILRVVLDYELKKYLCRDLAKLGKERHSAEATQAVAQKHGLQVVRGKIPVPDVRIEYQTRDGEQSRADLELATGHYRGQNLAEKARAGFALYAHGEDVSKLKRVLDERELTAEILSL
jgi:hypothetical protein